MGTTDISPLDISTPPGSPISVYVYDRHDLVRAGMRALIDGAPGCIVVGSSGSESQAWADVVRLRPAVAVLGGCLGDDQALTLCRRVRSAVPTVGCVVAPTAIEHPFGPFEAAAAGADAFVLKRLRGFPVLAAIAAVAHGGHPLADAVARAAAT